MAANRLSVRSHARGAAPEHPQPSGRVVLRAEKTGLQAGRVITTPPPAHTNAAVSAAAWVAVMEALTQQEAPRLLIAAAAEAVVRIY